MAVAESLGVGGDKQLNHQGWEDVAGGGEMRWGSAMMGGAGERRGGRPRLDTRREHSMLLSVQCKM
jgi:hypothetical protein